MMKKKSKPSFVVPNSKSIMRVPSRWRKPQGIDSKKRIRQSSEGACPRVGYKNPPEIRFMHPSGMREVMIHNTHEIVEGMKNVVLRIAGSVGGRKRVEIQKKAESLKLRVLNPRKAKEAPKKEASAAGHAHTATAHAHAHAHAEGATHTHEHEHSEHAHEGHDHSKEGHTHEHHAKEHKEGEKK